jgi:uncharacterized protein (DUF1697 family)
MAAQHVVLLRGINVGSGERLPMAALRDFGLALGFAEARTVLQSGNLVLSGAAEGGAALEEGLEAEAMARLALKSDFLVRSADEWRESVAQNPFPDAARDDPSHLLAFFLKSEPAAEACAGLAASIQGRETTRVVGRTCWIVYPDGIGDSKLTNVAIERRLGVRGTGRNWNTLGKITALLGG